MTVKTSLLSLAAVGFLALSAPFSAAEGASIGVGQKVISSDGEIVGTIRSKARKNGDRTRLFLRTKTGGVFQRRRVEAIIDVSQGSLSTRNGAIVLPATEQQIRNRAITPSASDDERIIRLRL